MLTGWRHLPGRLRGEDVPVTIVWTVLACWVALAVVCAPLVGMMLRRNAPGIPVEPESRHPDHPRYPHVGSRAGVRLGA